MIIFPDVHLNDVISFTLYPYSLIPTQYTQCKIVSVLDIDSAKMYIDPIALHANVYPTLPNGHAPDDPSQYLYLKIKHTNDSYSVIGQPWVIESSIEKHSSLTLTITIEDANTDDVTHINEILSANGYHSASVDLS